MISTISDIWNRTIITLFQQSWPIFPEVAGTATHRPNRFDALQVDAIEVIGLMTNASDGVIILRQPGCSGNCSEGKPVYCFMGLSLAQTLCLVVCCLRLAKAHLRCFHANILHIASLVIASFLSRTITFA
jgi:hypothetical protein